ncbi:structural contituent of cuticle [Holotrichia oblita]|uniref:Structural contituent of cuticle n=1 Tax=Holotrichia oblita TaxID=644536 RepID=A0ACB9TC25_HOLOL|nr:structural contituent of cuticle [Holotrichia oblita]
MFAKIFLISALVCFVCAGNLAGYSSNVGNAYSGWPSGYGNSGWNKWNGYNNYNNKQGSYVNGWNGNNGYNQGYYNGYNNNANGYSGAATSYANSNLQSYGGYAYGSGYAYKPGYGSGSGSGYGSGKNYNSGGWNYDSGNYAYPRYNFKYGVNDLITGDQKYQQEQRDGDRVWGSYGLKESDGTTRDVQYTADDRNGFNAVVTRTGIAKHPY